MVFRHSQRFVAAAAFGALMATPFVGPHTAQAAAQECSGHWMRVAEDASGYMTCENGRLGFEPCPSGKYAVELLEGLFVCAPVNEKPTGPIRGDFGGSLALRSGLKAA